MPTIYSANGYRITRDPNDGSATAYDQASFSMALESNVETVTFTQDAQGPGLINDFPLTRVNLSPEPLIALMDGVPFEKLHPAATIITSVGELSWTQGISTVLNVRFEAQVLGAPSFEYLIFISGAPLPEFASDAAFQNFINVEIGNPPMDDAARTEPLPLDVPVSLPVLNWSETQELITPQDRAGTAGDDTYIGSSEADVLNGAAGDDVIIGAEGDDIISGGAGADHLAGGSGTDTAVFAGDQTSYTVQFSADGLVVTNRGTPADGADSLTGFEFLSFDTAAPGFGDAPLDLGAHAAAAQLDAVELREIVELYIAYFDRAPDALGLYFWASAYASGTGLDEMAAGFFDQSETQGAYAEVLTSDGASVQDVDGFVSAVYRNVLGRDADQEGRAFWVDVLGSGAITTPQFIREIIAGAKAEPAADSDQAFVDQQLADRAYLSAKVDIGTEFAAIRGMSDVDAAEAIMAIYDGSADSLTTVLAQLETAHQAALDPMNGDFLMPLVGVVETPFG